MKTKKETTLSVLKDIRTLLQKADNRASSTAVDALNVITPSAILVGLGYNNDKYWRITFPEKTAKEIMDKCSNKLGDGKFLYNVDWYKNEDFFTKEKTRPGVRYVAKDFIGQRKDWNECKELVEKEKGEMMNFAELLWLHKTYFEEHKLYLDSNLWSWTSSRSSDGNFVFAGGAGAGGLGVGRGGPGGSGSDIVVRFFRSYLNN